MQKTSWFCRVLSAIQAKTVAPLGAAKLGAMGRPNCRLYLWFGLLAMALFALASCQGSYASTDPTAPIEVSATLGISDAWKQPDSLTWAIGGGSHQSMARQQISSSQITAYFTLNACTTDSIQLGIWSLGMRSAVVGFRQQGTAAQLVMGAVTPDNVAFALLKTLSIPRTRDSLYAHYARHLIHGDAGFGDFPRTCPVGIDTARLLRTALLYALSLPKPFADLAKKWWLDLDTTSQRQRLESLVTLGLATDSQMVRALHPVRIKVPVAVPDFEMGTTVQVHGQFQSDAGLAHLGFRIEQGTADQTSRFRILISPLRQLNGSQTWWDLDADAALLIGNGSATPGAYVLSVWVTDTAGHCDTARAPFQLLPPADRTAPSLIWVAPTSQRLLEFPDSLYTVAVQVSDASGLREVRINEAVVPGQHGVYGRQILVPVSNQGVAVVVRATDSAGNVATDSVWLLRKTAPKPDDPRIALRSQLGSVPFETTSVRVEWSVVDPAGRIDSVLIHGVPVAAHNDSLYAREVPLEPTGKPSVIVLKVYARGLVFLGEASVTRAIDASGPQIQWVSPSLSVSVEATVTSAKLQVRVTDLSGVDSVEIAGAKAHGDSGALWSAIVTLGAPDGKPVPLVVRAWDRLGNVATDSSLTITRRRDEVPPQITKGAGVVNRSVPYDTALIQLTWNLSDAFGIGAITLNGDRMGSGLFTVSRSYGLVVGTNTIVLSVRDAGGNVAFDTVVVVRLPAAPTHSAARNRYIGTVYDTITSVGADSIEVSTDSIHWTRYRDVFALNATGAITSYARAWPGGAVSAVVVEISQIRAMAAGYRHSLFVKTDGTVWTTGSNEFGQLGDGTTITKSSPVQVGAGVQAVAGGYDHSLLMKVDSSAWATGANDYGQLGDGTTVAKSIPVLVLTGGVAVAAGSGHSLFLKPDGSVWATGFNVAGVFGDGTKTNTTSPVRGFAGVQALAAADYHSLFLKTDGSAWASGANGSGQLGDGTSINKAVPVPCLTGVKAVAVGMYHSLFLKADSSVWATGANTYGQLGDGTKFPKSTPTQVLRAVTAVAGGSMHSLFLKADRTVWATGANASGQLGDGTIIDKSSPVQVLAGVQAMVGGGLHSLFLKTDGTLWATGDNRYGQLGDGTTTTKSAPVRINF